MSTLAAEAVAAAVGRSIERNHVPRDPATLLPEMVTEAITPATLVRTAGQVLDDRTLAEYEAGAPVAPRHRRLILTAAMVHLTGLTIGAKLAHELEDDPAVACRYLAAAQTTLDTITAALSAAAQEAHP